MKRQLNWIVMMGLLACGSSVAKAALINGNLDATSISGQVLATPTGWTAVANKSFSGAFNDGMSSEGFANVLDPGGNGLFFKPFQGVPTNLISANLYQDSPGAAGLTYTLTGWAGAGAGYIGLTDASVKSQFQLVFLNAASVPIGGAILDLRAAGLGTGAATPPAGGFGYHPYSLSALAPAGTAFVRAEADMLNAYGNPAGGDQAYVVDAFTLDIPEPSVIGLGMLGMTGLMLFRRRS